MPSTGFYLFLRGKTSTDIYTNFCVNALNGLLLISSSISFLRSRIEKIVSMPSTGFYLFLLPEGDTYQNPRNLCQCPQRASTYFFWVRDLRQRRKSARCQCPQRASTYFFSVSGATVQTIDVCQCPQRASTYFFVYNRQFSNGTLVMCQCPQRASTYFFENQQQSIIKCRVVSMPSTGFYLFLQYPPRTLDFTEFWRGFLQVIN